MNDRLIIHDDADKTPPAPQGRHPLAPISGADFAKRSHTRLPAQAWLLITVLASLPVLLILWGAWQAVAEAVLAWPWLPSAMGLGLLMVATLATLGLLGTLGARGWVSVQQARVVRTAHGAPVAVDLAMRMDPFMAEAQQIELEMIKAPYMIHPMLSTQGGGQSATKAEPLALPVPSQSSLIPDGVWFPWLDSTPHLMVAGATNAGKTTLATAILGTRGHGQICVLDPHDQPGKWLGGQAIGGGRNYPAIYAALAGIMAEMDRRYVLYNQGVKHFDLLTVVIDEVPAIVLRDKKTWAKFASQLGSEARKVNMRMVLLTQSPLVRDIEVSSIMLENFTRLALGDQAGALVGDEPNPKRKLALLELLKGQDYAAAIEHKNEVHLLDTTRIPARAQGVKPAPLWQPPRVVEAQRLSQEAATKVALGLLKAKGATRDQARAMGLQFSNDLWSEV